MIIDRPEVLRRLVGEHGAKPTHPGAESLVGTLADELDRRAAMTAAVMDRVWSEGEWQHRYVPGPAVGSWWL